MLCFHSRAGKLNETLERLNIKNNVSSIALNSKSHLNDALNNLPTSTIHTSPSQRLSSLPRRKHGSIVLRREAEELLGLKIPNDVSRRLKKRRNLLYIHW